MNLKELFEKAEGGVLNYDQFVAAAQENKAKFVDLSEGGYVDRQKYTDELAARDTRITTLDETIKTRDTDLANLRQQLDTAGTDATKLADLQNNFTDLQKKYDKDVKDMEKKMYEQNYRHAVNDFANQQNFTSGAAKRDFISSLMAKNLQMENDTIIGATDFMTAYAQDNADAFVIDEPPAEPEVVPPHFVNSTNSGNNSTGDADEFHFNFTGIRPHDN